MKKIVCLSDQEAKNVFGGCCCSLECCCITPVVAILFFSITGSFIKDNWFGVGDILDEEVDKASAAVSIQLAALTHHLCLTS